MHAEERRSDLRAARTRSGSPPPVRLKAPPAVDVIRRHERERAAVAPPVEVVGRRDRTEPAALARALLGERHHAIGARIRQRPPQHRVDDAEDRGVGADAERQREERDDRESRLPPQHPNAEHRRPVELRPTCRHAPQALRRSAARHGRGRRAPTGTSPARRAACPHSHERRARAAAALAQRADSPRADRRRSARADRPAAPREAAASAARQPRRSCGPARFPGRARARPARAGFLSAPRPRAAGARSSASRARRAPASDRQAAISGSPWSRAGRA